jgi:hypothetical protein
MMRSFMILGSLTRGSEHDEDLGGRNTMPFTVEDAVMMVCGGCPQPRRRCMSNPSPGTLAPFGWGHGGTWV